MLAGGVVLIVVAAGLVVWHVVSRRKAGYLTAARRRSAGELRRSAETLARELGESGGLDEMVELVGDVRCPEPLTSPLGERPCAHYRMRIVREYEEEYEQRESDGTVRRGTRRSSETMSTQSESRDFDLVDESGALRVRLEGASFDGLTETVNRFEPGEQMGANVSFGRFSMALGRLGPGRRTLGFRYHEVVLPLDRRLTVIGRANDAGGEVAVGAGGNAFLVTTRSKSEIIGSAETTAKITAALSGIALLAGLGLVIAGALGG